jgi:hemerythrin
MRTSPFVEWQPRFEIGIPSIDGEHRRFFELINELHAAIVAGSGQVRRREALAELAAYAEAHFAGEERWFATYAYPGAAAHRGEHDAFRSRLEGVAVEGGASSVQVLSLMSDWLLQHILGSDRRFGDWLRAARPPEPERQGRSRASTARAG